MSKYKIIILAILAVSLISAGVLTLTDPDISRYNTGAGGQSTGGGYTLTGSLGQHDAGETLTGGGFSLNGGFWGAGGEWFFDIFIPLVIN